MTNFEFLKNINKELYEIGKKLEKDVINSPRAVTADATIFLETLVKDLYKKSNKKLEKNLISFYKKTDNLYRQGAINYKYKNKLQQAYALRNKIHNKNLTEKDEQQLAYDIHKEIFYISKKYYTDHTKNKNTKPTYTKPTKQKNQFKNCIICGNPNKKSPSNICIKCNQKIETANLIQTLQNKIKNKQFTRNDLIKQGITESQAILILMKLTQKNIINNNGQYYTINTENFKKYITQTKQYIQIPILINKFYKNEITPQEIKQTSQYKKGRENQKPYQEFYKIINQKITTNFEKTLQKYKNINKSKKTSAITNEEITKWYLKNKTEYENNNINTAFKIYNDILIEEYFKLKNKGYTDKQALTQLQIPNHTLTFWKNNYKKQEFTTKTLNIKKNIIINEIRKNKTIKDTLITAQTTQKEFEKIYQTSKESNDNFYKQFHKQYTQKRQKQLIKHLKKHNLDRAIKLSKITKNEFLQWYYEGETTYSEFYMKTTQILMKKYINYRENNWNKKEILNKIKIPKTIFDSWNKHENIKLFKDFNDKNNKITSNLIKRGLIINAIKEGKTKHEAIFSSNLTPKEFMDIYNTSKKEKTEFYLRFDTEYEKSRKNKFTNLIKKQDFYNTIQECEISKMEFKKWYSKDQDYFISTKQPTNFYLTTTLELMDKYIKARFQGKNKPDAAKSVGLSNNDINKWINHTEHDLFKDFQLKLEKLHTRLIIEGFKQEKSKIEVSETYDIPVKTIEKYIGLGGRGFMNYMELFNLYEDKVIPKHLNMFLNAFKSKSYYKSLKHSKLTKEELKFYYNLGKSGNNKFKDFYKDFLNLKINIYVDNILSNKSSKIAMKNSNLTKEEYKMNLKIIDDLILNGRLDIAKELILKYKLNGAKLAKKIGIGVEEVYEWYFKGKDDDEKYVDFCKIFEFGVILPRLIAFNKASDLGMSKKWLIKKLKKDLGMKDFNIWKNNGLIDLKEVKIKIKGVDLIDDKIIPLTLLCKNSPASLSRG